MAWLSLSLPLSVVRPRCWGGVSSGESMATASVTPGRARGCMRHAACGTHPNDDHVRVTSGPDAVSRTRLCREVCRFRTGGAPSAKAVHGLCGGCHPRPAGRTSGMHHGVCRRMWIPSTLEIGVRMRLRAALPAAGRVITMRRGEGARPPASRLARTPRARGVIAPVGSSVRASGRSVLSPSEKCPTRCAGRAVRGARRCGSVQSRAAPPIRLRRSVPASVLPSSPSRPVPHGRR